MLKDFIGRAFRSTREEHAKLDAAILRSKTARARAAKACESIDIDWGPSMEAAARARQENPCADVHLPLEANGVPSPEAEEAAARERRSRA